MTTAKIYRAAQWLTLALLLIGVGAGLVHFLKSDSSSVPSTLTVRITGPSTITHPGQFVIFTADVSPRQADELIYTWSVTPLSEMRPGHPVPSIRPTRIANEAHLDAVSGRWRVTVNVADPGTRTGESASIEVHVPECNSEPEPHPGPHVPFPPMPPGPGPSSRFVQFSREVAVWIEEVSSPHKREEIEMIIAGAEEIIQSLRAGALSQHTGITLRIAVASEVMRSNSRVRNKAAWSAFGQKINAAAGQALKANELNTARDWAEFLTAFTNGLR